MKIRILIVKVVLIVSIAALVSVRPVEAQPVDLPFVEKGVLYRSPVESLAGKAQKAIAENVGRVLHYNQDTAQLIHVTKPSAVDSDIITGGDLVLTDTVTWSTRIIAQDIVTAHISPHGDMIVLWNKNHQVRLVTSQGVPIKEIGIHGAAPIFSHDKRFIAYQKLADHSPDSNLQSLFEHAQGIAVYDMYTMRESLVTNGGGDDFAPVGFSNDISKLYFNSTRPSVNEPENHIASLWVLDLATRITTQLTNTDVREGDPLIPTVNENALWSSDRRIAISSNGKEQGTWMFLLSQNKNTVEARHIADGDSPQWLVLNKRIAVRSVENGQSKWRTIDVQ